MDLFHTFIINIYLALYESKLNIRYKVSSFTYVEESTLIEASNRPCNVKIVQKPLKHTTDY